MRSTISVVFTLSFTSGEWVSEEVGWALTNTPVCRWSGNGISATWIGHTRIPWRFRLAPTFLEGITYVTRQTFTDGVVTFDKALGVDATHSNTRVSTLLANASFVAWAVSVNGTFRSAVWRGSKVTWLTHTGCITILVFAESVASTWVRVTRINDHSLSSHFRNY